MLIKLLKDDIEVQIHNDLDNINDYTIPTG